MHCSSFAHAHAPTEAGCASLTIWSPVAVCGKCYCKLVNLPDIVLASGFVWPLHAGYIRSQSDAGFNFRSRTAGSSLLSCQLETIGHVKLRVTPLTRLQLSGTIAT